MCNIFDNRFMCEISRWPCFCTSRHKNQSHLSVVCLTFALRKCVCINFQRNPSTELNKMRRNSLFMSQNEPNPVCACLRRSLNVNVSISDPRTRVKSLRCVERKEGAQLSSPLQGKFCLMQFFICDDKREKVSPLTHREGLFPGDVILWHPLPTPLHTPLLRM